MSYQKHISKARERYYAMTAAQRVVRVNRMTNINKLIAFMAVAESCQDTRLFRQVLSKIAGLKGSPVELNSFLNGYRVPDPNDLDLKKRMSQKAKAKGITLKIDTTVPKRMQKSPRDPKAVPLSQLRKEKERRRKVERELEEMKKKMSGGVLPVEDNKPVKRRIRL